MNRSSSPGNRPSLEQAARQSGSESTPADIDARIRELEQAKQELEAQLAEAKTTPLQSPAPTSPKKTPKKQPAPSRANQSSAKGQAVVAAAATRANRTKGSVNTTAPARSTQPPVDSDNNGSKPAEEPTAAEGGRRWFGSRQVPAWAISMLVHLVLLLVLGLITLAVPAVTDYSIIVASEDGEEALEEMAEIDLAQDLENMEDLSPSLDAPSISESEMSELTLATNVAEVSDIGPEAFEQDSVSQINAIFSEDGTAMESLSDKVGKMTASFFGSKAKGRRFVFVVDNSNSMQRGRFHTAVNELVKTVEQMEADQYFYVIFFSDTAYPLFWPSPVSQLVPATRKNKERLQQWLYTVELCLHTRGSEAMQLALSLRPDAIYVLGDGAFTDKTAQQLTLPHNRRTPIFTLGMQVPEKGKTQLTQIAKANNGTYRLVTVAPGAAQAAARAPIKKNNLRGPVWGIKLPVKRNKK